MNTVAQMFLFLCEALATCYDRTTAQQYARWLLAEVTDIPARCILIDGHMTISLEQSRQLHVWLTELTQMHKPLQYILGWVPFGNVHIFTRPPVLIPRPETEEWCMFLVDMLKNSCAKNLHILDIGTGSGCVAVALAHALPDCTVTAVDIDQHACALAAENAAHNNITNVQILYSDMYTALNKHVFDLIVSNPPYIAENEWNTLSPTVREWEHRTALIAGETGMEYIAHIIDNASTYLRHNEILADYAISNIWLEVGHTQAQVTQNKMKQAGFSEAVIWQDSNNHGRVVHGRI
jgi:release factor glutamine methyltransferase